MARATETVHGIRASRGLLAGALALAVLWGAVLAASSGLHEWVHPDAGHEDHDCAVTLFLSGAVGPAIAPPPPIDPLALLVADLRYRNFLPLPFVGPSARSVLEHGPPQAFSRSSA